MKNGSAHEIFYRTRPRMSPFRHLGSRGDKRRVRYAVGYPRKQPRAENSHAGICEGGSRTAELLDCHTIAFMIPVLGAL